MANRFPQIVITPVPIVIFLPVFLKKSIVAQPIPQIIHESMDILRMMTIRKQLACQFCQ